MCPFTYCLYRETSRSELREDSAGLTAQTEIVSNSSCGETIEAAPDTGGDGVFQRHSENVKI